MASSGKIPYRYGLFLSDLRPAEGFHYSTVSGTVDETRRLILFDPGEMHAVMFSTVCTEAEEDRRVSFSLYCSVNLHVGGAFIYCNSILDTVYVVCNERVFCYHDCHCFVVLGGALENILGKV